MKTYDPNEDLTGAPMPNVNEELAMEALKKIQEAQSKMGAPSGLEIPKSVVPTGLIRRVPEGSAPEAPEKDVGESQMADFATNIDDVMPGLQNEVMGPPLQQMQSPSGAVQQDDTKKTKKTFGLTKDQLTALIAGVAAVIAFSKPVQGKLSTMVPKFLNDAGDISITGMAVTALVAAIIFYFAKNYLKSV